MCFGVVGSALQQSFEVRNRLRRPPLLNKAAAEIEVGGQLIRVNGQRLTIFLDRGVHVAALPQSGAEVDERSRTLRVGCHGRRELGVIEQPLALLENVRGLEYCELPNIEECCGFGGTFSVKMPGTSLAMGQSKVENIIQSGADVVTSIDVSCLMHIDGMLRRNPEPKNIRTMHLAEVLVSGTE